MRAMRMTKRCAAAAAAAAARLFVRARSHNGPRSWCAPSSVPDLDRGNPLRRAPARGDASIYESRRMKAEAAQIRQVERKSTRLTNKRRRSRRRNFRPLTAGIRRSPPPPPPTPTKTHTNDPCKCGHAALRCAIVHSRRDFRPATGSETHVFGRVCSHNTISLPPPSLPPPPASPYAPPYVLLPLARPSVSAVQCAPCWTIRWGKRTSALGAHVTIRACIIIRVYRSSSSLLVVLSSFRLGNEHQEK